MARRMVALPEDEHESTTTQLPHWQMLPYEVTLGKAAELGPRRTRRAIARRARPTPDRLSRFFRLAVFITNTTAARCSPSLGRIGPVGHFPALGKATEVQPIATDPTIPRRSTDELRRGGRAMPQTD
jgi:hypothetical protein